MIKNIIVRALSGGVYVSLIVTTILLLDNSPIAFVAIFSLFAVLGVKEIYDITTVQKNGDARDVQSSAAHAQALNRDALGNAYGDESWLVELIDMLGAVGVFVTLRMIATDTVADGVRLLPLVSYVLVRCVLQLYRPGQNAIHSLSRSFFAVTYVALPLGLLNTIAAMTAPRLLLALFVFIWVNDTGAFLTGVALGRHRLFERISPKKSWEGFVGGVALCVIAALAADRWCNEFFEVPQLGVWVGLALVVAVSATLGDLVESLIKRTAGVKDSGHLIPGHGGLLDRIDSLLLVSPATVAYLAIVLYN